MVRFKTLSRDEAKRIISAFDNYDDVEFDDLVNHWEQYDPVSEYDESFVDFRNELLAAFREGLQETNGKMDYPVDLKVGLKIYSLLPIGKNFSIVQANNDDFWRYISVKVMPDITYLRYPNPEKAVKDAGGRLNHKRFYAQTRRIWLKSLWWYVFLSWQGSELKTYNALKNNKTDNINKLIETPGRGYRLMLYRAMIAEYAKYSALNKTSTKEFQLMEVVVNDSVTREAISRAEERKFLRFVKEDPHFCRYYEGIYILFKTGLRISEFCGLTISDIDFKEHTINIDHQLQKKSKIGYYIQETKTTSGTRKIPMTADVEECFRKIIEKRNPPKAEPMVDGKSGFLYFDKNESICYSLHWEHYFQHIIQKYNNTYKVQMPVITPHVCRHTYCSNMAKSGMNPKALQYLMGHSEISVTLNTYTHVNLEDAREEVARIQVV